MATALMHAHAQPPGLQPGCMQILEMYTRSHPLRSPRGQQNESLLRAVTKQKVLTLLGIEPRIPCSVGRYVIHYTIEPLAIHGTKQANYI